MNGFMNPAEFANIAKSERDFWWFRGMREIFFRALAPHLEGRKISRALEAGCGTGYMASLLQKAHGWPLIPTDISGDGLRYARRMGVANRVQSNALSLPFPDATFDLLMSFDLLVHLPQGVEASAAREWSRVLAPGGLLVVRAAAFNTLLSRHSAFVYERQRFTRRQLTRVFAAAGIRILRATYANSLLLPVALFKFRVWEPLLRLPPSSGVASMPPWLDRLLYTALALESRWIGSGRNLPVGQSVLLIGEKIL